MLLDTHAFLWMVADDPRLSPGALGALTDPDGELVLSAASLWELAIKVGNGKLILSEPLADFVAKYAAAYRLEALPISAAHALAVAALPFHHKDPFDRLLIAQAITEGIPLISGDGTFDAYPIRRLW
jgi:PIN domain nuclease of toxin-antitoxin system